MVYVAEVSGGDVMEREARWRSGGHGERGERPTGETSGHSGKGSRGADTLFPLLE